MSFVSTRRARVALSTAAIGVLVALAACAPTPEAEPSASPTPEASTPAPYAGPLAFVGDELERFLPTPEEISAILPEAADITDPSDFLTQISDGGGVAPVPAICEILYLEQSLGSVGARVVDWTVPTDPEYGQGRLTVMQFADEAHAQTRMDQLVQAAEQCGQFTKEGPATYDAVIAPGSEGVRAFAGTLRDVQAGYDWRSFTAFAATGNVLVELWQPFTGDRTYDAAAAGALLQAHAEEARQALIDDLTANPPVAEEDVPADGSAAWSEWQIGVGGVGPIRLGAPVDAAVAAAGGSEVREPSYESGPWTIVNAEGTGSILVFPIEGGDTVGAIAVGNDRSLDEASQDGAALPARGEVRVGASLADAAAAFPGGTYVDVVSSGDDYYAVTTRDGRVFRFQSDRDTGEDGAVIVGIIVEDATAQPSLVLG